LALVAVALLAGLGEAQKSIQEKKQATEKHKSTPRGMVTGKVTQVDSKEKTFTLVAKGKTYRFVLEKATQLPKVDTTIDVTYEGTPDDSKPLAAKAIQLNTSRSN